VDAWVPNPEWRQLRQRLAYNRRPVARSGGSEARMKEVLIALIVLVAIGVLSGIAQGAGADVYGVARRAPRRLVGWRRGRGSGGPNGSGGPGR
jgi:hypothetical protein